METSALEISSLLGLCALVVFSINFLLGLLLSASYRRSVLWKRLPGTLRQLSIRKVHNWTAYVAVSLGFAHPVALTFEKAGKFAAADIFIPFHTSYQPVWVAFGVVSFYTLLTVVVTSQKRIKGRMAFRFWKNIHLISYATAVLVCLHGIFLDPELKQRPPDLFDGEKLVCEICLLSLVIAAVVRARFYYKKKATGVSSKRKRNRHQGAKAQRMA